MEPQLLELLSLRTEIKRLDDEIQRLLGEAKELDKRLAADLNEGLFEFPQIRERGFVVHRSEYSVYGISAPERYIEFLPIRVVEG